jgi:tol-pal system protein YbgF
MLLEETQLMEGNLRTLDWMKRWIILVLVVLFFGCATSEDVRILDEDIRRFPSQLNLMQKDEDALRRELSAFQKKNQEEISALQTETKRLQTDLPLRLENLQSEMRILSTGVEEYKEFLKKPSREIDRVKEDIGSRTKVLEERGKTFEEKNRTLEDQTKALGEKIKGIEDRFKGLEEKITGLAAKLTEMEKPPPTKEVPAEVKGVSTSVGDLYKDAYETFQKGNLEGARRKFEAFLKQYPNTELSDNAQFWIGETYFLKKDFEKAILEYEKAIVKYPEGDKIPAVLFKQALAFLELGDKTNARNLLKRVIERYPHSEQAEMAKKRLEGIK